MENIKCKKAKVRYQIINIIIIIIVIIIVIIVYEFF